MRRNFEQSLPSALITSIGIHVFCFLALFFFMTNAPQKMYVTIPIDFIPPSSVINEEPLSKDTSPQSEKKALSKPIQKKEHEEKPIQSVSKKEVPHDTDDTLQTNEKKETTASMPQGIRTRSRVTNTVSRPTFSSTINTETSFPYAYYLKILYAKLNAAWDIPQGIGTQYAQVYFRLNRDGQMILCRIEKSSANPVFDEAVIRTLKKSAPFPPLPDEYTETSLGVYCNFEWKE